MTLIKAFPDTFHSLLQFVFEPQYGCVQLLLVCQGQVHDWIFDQMLGWNLGTRGVYSILTGLGLAGMFISFVYFYYRSLVNVPCKICRRESQL